MTSGDDAEDAVDLSGLESVQNTIRTYGLHAKKQFGQHFLLDPAILSRIAQGAGDLRGVRTLEVGPGPGGLSRAILEAGAMQLTAVEQDARCIEALQPLIQTAGGRFELIEGDIMRSPLPESLVGAAASKTSENEHADRIMIIANLPYNISAPLLIKWLEALDQIGCMVLMFQKEVAQRIQASHKDEAYGRLSVAVQSNCHVERLFDLPPGAFHPPPKVHSTVLKIAPKEDRPDTKLRRTISSVAAAAFNQRRKMLRSSLKSLGVDVALLCEKADIAPTARADALSVDDYGRLAKSLIAIKG